MKVATCYWIMVFILFSGCTNEQSDGSHSQGFCDFLAMTIFDQIYMYENGAKEGITEMSSYFKLESALQENLLRALFLVEFDNITNKKRTQLNYSLAHAKEVLRRHPIRTIFFENKLHHFGDQEPVLPRNIDAYALFVSFFGKEAVRELN